MNTVAKNKIPDPLDLSAELDGIAAGINVCNTIIKEWDSPDRPYDQPAPESLSEMLWGLEQHLLRVSEDYMTYCGILEDQLKDSAASTKKGDRES